MNYVRIRLFTGGTYTTGIGLDWSLQFDAAQDRAIQTMAGEITTDSTTYGMCADYCVYANSQYDVSVYVEASAGHPVQVVVNGAILSELTAVGEASVHLDAGPNVVKFVRDIGPITVYGRLFDGRTSKWTSLYPSGADPFAGGLTAQSAASSSTPGG